MNTHVKKTKLSALAPLLLFAVFTLCVIGVLLTGAKIYRNYTKQDQVRYDHRTVAQYLTTRIRQSDAVGAYRVGDFASVTAQTEGDTFFFLETIGEETYCTRLYCHEGYLYELFSLAEDPFEPGDGERILAVDELWFAVSDRTVTVTLRYADGQAQTLVLHMRSQSEVSP